MFLCSDNLQGTLPLRRCGQQAAQIALSRSDGACTDVDCACCEGKAKCHASQVSHLHVAVQMCGCWKLHNNDAGAKD